MCGHVLSGRLTAGFASRTEKFCRPVIRVRPPQEVRREENGRACALWQSNFRLRVQIWKFLRVYQSGAVDIGGRLLYNIDVFLSVLSETGTGQSPSANGKKQLRRFQINKEVRRQHEKNVSAQKAAEKQSAWLPQAHGKQKWQKCLKTPPRQGEKKTDCLVLSRAATLCYSLFSHGRNFKPGSCPGGLPPNSGLKRALGPCFC